VISIGWIISGSLNVCKRYEPIAINDFHHFSTNIFPASELQRTSFGLSVNPCTKTRP
jgi:hypothetical protein